MVETIIVWIVASAAAWCLLEWIGIGYGTGFFKGVLGFVFIAIPCYFIVSALVVIFIYLPVGIVLQAIARLIVGAE